MFVMVNEKVMYFDEEVCIYFVNIWCIMCECMECGMNIEGILFGFLCVLCCVVVLC